MNQTEKTARIERIRELIKELRTPRVGASEHIIANILELLADLAERS
jgi:hypothetical protein